MQQIILASCRIFSEYYPDGLVSAIDLFDLPPSKITVHQAVDKKFPDGEICVELPNFIGAPSVFVFQSLCFDSPRSPDAALFAIMATARAYKEHGAQRVVAVVPHLAYSRQDRIIENERRPVTARLVADLLHQAGVDGLVTIRSGSSRSINPYFSKLSLEQVDFEKFTTSCAIQYSPETSVLVAPDANALDDIKKITTHTGHRYVGFEKRRTGAEHVISEMTHHKEFVGAEHGLIIDDLVCSAGTIKAAITALRAHGIKKFSVAVPHCRLTQTGKGRLVALANAGILKKLHTTDAVPITWSPNFLKVTPFLTAFHSGLHDAIQHFDYPRNTEN